MTVILAESCPALRGYIVLWNSPRSTSVEGFTTVRDATSSRHTEARTVPDGRAHGDDGAATGTSMQNVCIRRYCNCCRMGIERDEASIEQRRPRAASWSREKVSCSARLALLTHDATRRQIEKAALLRGNELVDQWRVACQGALALIQFSPALTVL